MVNVGKRAAHVKRRKIARKTCLGTRLLPGKRRPERRQSACKAIQSVFPARSTGMTSLQLKGNWNEVKGKLKQKYAQLTDDDLTFAEGKEDELLGRLQKRLGKSKDDIRREIEDF